jgi:nitric oxide synthase-interacting protein
VPSLTPSTGQSELANQERKLSTLCPASDPKHTHPLSLKSLVPVNFSEDPQDKTKDGLPLRICPSCKKALNNNLRSFRISHRFKPSDFLVAPVCGHVTCVTCTALLRESGVCFVCETPFKKKRKEKEGKESKKDKEKIGDVDGLIELQVEGSGYAAGSKGPGVELKRQAFG